MSEPRAGVSNFLAQQLKLVLVSAGFNAKQIKQARAAHALGPQMETVTKKGSDIPTVVVTKVSIYLYFHNLCDQRIYLSLFKFFARYIFLGRQLLMKQLLCLL